MKDTLKQKVEEAIGLAVFNLTYNLLAKNYQDVFTAKMIPFIEDKLEELGIKPISKLPFKVVQDVSNNEESGGELYDQRQPGEGEDSGEDSEREGTESEDWDSGSEGDEDREE